MSAKTDDKGRILIDNLTAIFNAGIEKFDSKLNHSLIFAWIKNVVSIDKSKTNGYSLRGDFYKVENVFWIYPGTILIAAYERRNINRSYYMGKLNSNGEIDILQVQIEEGAKWAVKFWDCIEQNLAKNDRNDFNPLSKITDEKLIQELTRRGYHIFDKTEKRVVSQVQANDGACRNLEID